jgi:hypothetical protein
MMIWWILPNQTEPNLTLLNLTQSKPNLTLPNLSLLNLTQSKPYLT